MWYSDYCVVSGRQISFGARDNIGGYDDYPGLFTRCFEYGTSLPIMRTRGSREYNDVWSYGEQVERSPRNI